MAYTKIEQYDEKVTSGLIEHYRGSIGLLGEDPDREGLVKTPERVAKAMARAIEKFFSRQLAANSP